MPTKIDDRCKNDLILELLNNFKNFQKSKLISHD